MSQMRFKRRASTIAYHVITLLGFACFRIEGGNELNIKRDTAHRLSGVHANRADLPLGTPERSSHRQSAPISA
jgi:hypothetical protein